MNSKILRVLVPISTISVLFVNYLAANGKIGGVTPEVISNKYPTNITPAGYAFSIWGLIYAGMIAFSIYQALPSQEENPRFQKVRLLYLLNCAANCAWIFLWHHEMIIGALVVIFVLLATLVGINHNLKAPDSTAETWLAKIPFSIYFGWVTVATILNATIALVYLGVSTSDFNAQILGAVLIVIALILGIFIRFKLDLPAYPLAIAWGLTAIAIKQGGQTIIVVTCAIAVIILLLISLSFVLNLKSSES